ncbi:MAG: RNA polymerase sigma factor [bacterium]
MSLENYKQEEIIKGCKRGKIESQQKLYMHYYGYAMSICLRYSKNKETAEEVLNDSFLKVFTKIKKYDIAYSFKSWLRKIIINTAIDHYRENSKSAGSIDINTQKLHNCTNKAVENLELEDMLTLLRKLSDIHRMVFNLYEMEGYSHKEIAGLLGVAEGTSRSYLKRAKQKLRDLYNNYFK